MGISMPKVRASKSPRQAPLDARRPGEPSRKSAELRGRWCRLLCLPGDEFERRRERSGGAVVHLYLLGLSRRDACPQREPANELEAAVDLELPEHGGNLVCHRSRARMPLRANLGIGEPIDDEKGDLSLGKSEVAQRPRAELHLRDGEALVGTERPRFRP